MLRIALVQFSFQRSPAISGRFLVFIGQLKLVLSVSQLVQINSQWFSANSGRFAVFLGQFKPICIVTWFFWPVQDYVVFGWLISISTGFSLFYNILADLLRFKLFSGLFQHCLWGFVIILQGYCGWLLVALLW
jgi:hypothetical protein